MKLLARILIAYLSLAVPVASALAGPLERAAAADCTMHEGGAAGHDDELPDCCTKAGMPAQKHEMGGKPCPCGPGFGCHAGTLLALPTLRMSLSFAPRAAAPPPRHLLRPPLSIQAQRWRPPAPI